MREGILHNKTEQVFYQLIKINWLSKDKNKMEKSKTRVITGL